MKIYTKTGDSGSTGLFGGPRVSKDHVRIEAYGGVDELNATLGLARSVPIPDRLNVVLHAIQHTLFSIGSEMATPDPVAHRLKWEGQQSIATLETTIDALESE